MGCTSIIPHFTESPRTIGIVTILMMTARVGRGGFFLLVGSEGGQTAIGVGSDSSKLAGASLIPCSIVGLYNVLSGVEYLVVEAGRQCLIRRVDKNVEIIWKRASVDTVIRLTISEYRTLLRNASDGTRDAA